MVVTYIEKYGLHVGQLKVLSVKRRKCHQKWSASLSFLSCRITQCKTWTPPIDRFWYVLVYKNHVVYLLVLKVNFNFSIFLFYVITFQQTTEPGLELATPSSCSLTHCKHLRRFEAISEEDTKAFTLYRIIRLFCEGLETSFCSAWSSTYSETSRLCRQRKENFRNEESFILCLH